MADLPSDEPAATDPPRKLPPHTAQVRNSARPRRLRKNVVVGVIAMVTGVLLLALVIGITKTPLGKRPTDDVLPVIADATNVPSFVKNGPKTYADVPAAPVVALGPAMHGDLAAAGVRAPQDSPFQAAAFADHRTREKTEDEKRLEQEWQAVLAAPVELTVKLDLGTPDPAEASPATRPPPVGHAPGALAGVQGEPLSAADPPVRIAPSEQAAKRAFLEQGASVVRDDRVSGTLQRPRSPYELKAGSVIPCTLITGINSDLPGDITCLVRQNVDDTVSGNYLLIPQGTRVVGTYDSQVIFGQSRVLVVWHRLILPNGNSVDLAGLPGVDLSGYAGYTDKVDNHWGRLIGAIVLSSVFAAAPVITAGNDTNYNRSINSEIARGAGQNTQQAGGQIVARELSVQPTITIRPGFAINIFVKKDLVLAPYTAQLTPEQHVDSTAFTP